MDKKKYAPFNPLGASAAKSVFPAIRPGSRADAHLIARLALVASSAITLLRQHRRRPHPWEEPISTWLMAALHEDLRNPLDIVPWKVLSLESIACFSLRWHLLYRVDDTEVEHPVRQLIDAFEIRATPLAIDFLACADAAQRALRASVRASIVEEIRIVAVDEARREHPHDMPGFLHDYGLDGELANQP